MNSLTISGNVGSVNEPKQLGDTTISEVSIAWNNPRKKDAEPMWVRVKLFGKQADLVRYIRKGDRLTVSGRLEIETWEKDGQTRFTLCCVANEIDLPPKSESATHDEPLRETPIAAPAPRNAPVPAASRPPLTGQAAKNSSAPVLKDFGLDDAETPF